LASLNSNHPHVLIKIAYKNGSTQSCASLSDEAINEPSQLSNNWKL